MPEEQFTTVSPQARAYFVAVRLHRMTNESQTTQHESQLCHQDVVWLDEFLWTGRARLQPTLDVCRLHNPSPLQYYNTSCHSRQTPFWRHSYYQQSNTHPVRPGQCTDADTGWHWRQTEAWQTSERSTWTSLSSSTRRPHTHTAAVRPTMVRLLRRRAISQCLVAGRGRSSHGRSSRSRSRGAFMLIAAVTHGFHVSRCRCRCCCRCWIMQCYFRSIRRNVLTLTAVTSCVDK